MQLIAVAIDFCRRCLSLKSALKNFSFTAALFCFCSAHPAHAAPDGVPLQIPLVIRIESGTDTALPIVTGSDPVAAKAMVVIRGIPWNVSLTTGRLFPSGVWALKASEARSARIITAGNTQQAAELHVSLVTLEGDDLGNATTRLEIEPGRQRATNAVAAVPLPAKPATILHGPTDIGGHDQTAAPERARQRVFSPADMDKVFKLMDRGDQHLLEGKIASARRFYQLAAETGWPEGALAIARTYDAEFLKRFPIIGGIQPNAAMAKQWYDTAREISLRPLPPDLQSVNQK
jgi:hypothetical protein